MTDKNVSDMSFEDAMAELDVVVNKLDRGEVALEESIDLYDRGAKLKAHCETKLKEAEEKVEKITARPNGAISTEKVEGL